MTTDASATPVLDRVHTPSDMRNFTPEELRQLVAELRHETISAVAHTGGHLGAGLGVVELTVALHYIFNTPVDKVIWDVGHQAYPHKILTGRRDRIRTIRQPGGLSGFCKRDESEYDVFGAGHSSTSISAGLGMAVARDLRIRNEKYSPPPEGGARGGAGEFPPGPSIPLRQEASGDAAHPSPSRGEGFFEVIAVIGDGAMSAGMAFEAMNNAGHLGTRLIIILNDNDMSIAPPTGAMSAYLSRLISSRKYHTFKDFAKAIVGRSGPLASFARNVEKYARGMAMGGTLFEEMGIHYVGPIDGHNLDHLLPVLKNIRDDKDTGPVLVHVVTRKGHGYAPAEASADKLHGVTVFDVKTGAQKKSAAGAPTYTKVFAESLIKEAQKDEKIVAITAAMPSGTGLDVFAEKFPRRCFDVGIAEQHAVTFAAGLAAEGYKPFATIYSTFLQRAYDQVVHDVAIQNLPVRFAIDRAGLVGADGPTHAGAFDVTYLASLPNFVVMAAADEAELVHMVATAAHYGGGPIAFRYPRGEGVGVKLPDVGIPLEIGKGRVVREGSRVALLSFGTRLQECLKAAEEINATVADARFAKPLDEALIRRLLAEHELVITVEEGSIGGFGSHVLDFAAREGLPEKTKLRALFLPDEFIEHGNPKDQYRAAGLDAERILDVVKDVLGEKPALKRAANR